MKKDIQKEITEKIIALIEEHGANWTKPFAEIGGSPTNAATGRKYRGVNAFWLGLLGKSVVATYNQWQSLGAQVLGNEKGTRISVPMTIKDKDTGEITGTWFGSANVYSADQVTGWEAPTLPEIDHTDWMIRTTTTAFAKKPICPHISMKLVIHTSKNYPVCSHTHKF